MRLIPEHDNPVDKNAIAVQMKWLSAGGKDVWEIIGYVPAQAAAIVNNLLSTGEWAIDQAFVRSFDASPDLDAPMVIVRLEGKDLREERP